MTRLRTITSAALLAAGCGLTAYDAATPPALVNYQGVLKDKMTGMPLNATVDTLFTFHPDAGSAGADILRDTHAGVVVSNGLFSLQLGGGVVEDGAGPGTYGSLSEVFRDFSEVWLEVRVGTETLSPRVRVAGAAYAMNATHLEGKRASEFIDTSNTYQYKAGTLYAGGLGSSGIEASSYIADYGDLYVLGNVSTNGSFYSGGRIYAFGGIEFGETGALQMPDGVTISSGRSPQQIATLHWYGANSQASFQTGSGPYAVAFDGSSIWVANTFNSNVTKLRASDGADLGTFFVGSPRGVAFDGSSIWVTTFNSNNVTKLRASDGANLGTFPVGTTPIGVAFDGSSIWVTNFNSNNVTKLRASDGATLGTFPVGSYPRGVAFDGSSIWVPNSGSNNVTKLRASDGATLGTFPVGDGPIGVAFDGSSIWVANFYSDSVTKLRASDGANLGALPVGSNPIGVAFDGSSIWVTNQNSGTVSKL